MNGIGYTLTIIAFLSLGFLWFRADQRAEAQERHANANAASARRMTSHLDELYDIQSIGDITSVLATCAEGYRCPGYK